MSEEPPSFKDRLFAELDAMSLEDARTKVRLPLYSGKNLVYAQEWLLQKEDGLKDAAQAEQAKLASRAALAAERAATAAEEAATAALDANTHASTANRIATAALAAAVIAIAVSIYGLLHDAEPSTPPSERAAAAAS